MYSCISIHILSISIINPSSVCIVISSISRNFQWPSIFSLRISPGFPREVANVDDNITAISFVALGTSVPDRVYKQESIFPFFGGSWVWMVMNWDLNGIEWWFDANLIGFRQQIGRLNQPMRGIFSHAVGFHQETGRFKQQIGGIIQEIWHILTKSFFLLKYLYFSEFTAFWSTSSYIPEKAKTTNLYSPWSSNSCCFSIPIFSNSPMFVIEKNLFPHFCWLQKPSTGRLASTAVRGSRTSSPQWRQRGKIRPQMPPSWTLLSCGNATFFLTRWSSRVISMVI